MTPSPSDQILHVGIDENGLGPVLGPMVVTLAGFSRTQGSQDRVQLSSIGDSKGKGAFGKADAFESLALASYECFFGRVPTHCSEIFEAWVHDGLEGWQKPCPSSSKGLCFDVDIALPAFGGSVEAGREMLRQLREVGRELKRVSVHVRCVKAFNRDVSRMGSKFTLDLDLFEEALIEARKSQSHNLIATCGMIGGIRNYPSFFQRLDVQRMVTVEQSRKRCEYQHQDVGTIVFEVDADDSSLEVSVASMIGKFIRELSMEKINRYLRLHQPDLRKASGYHDLVTKKLIGDSQVLRREKKIDDDCFMRRG